MLKGAAVGAHCKPCALLEGLVGVLLPRVGKTVIRLCRSRRERLFKNCFNMAPAITLSELAWIFKRELAIMISLCRFSFCFYFSQKKNNNNNLLYQQSSAGVSAWISRVRPISLLRPCLPREGALRALAEMESPVNKIIPI